VGTPRKPKLGFPQGMKVTSTPSQPSLKVSRRRDSHEEAEPFIGRNLTASTGLAATPLWGPDSPASTHFQAFSPDGTNSEEKPIRLGIAGKVGFDVQSGSSRDAQTQEISDSESTADLEDSQSEPSAETADLSGPRKSGVKGVYWSKQNKAWIAKWHENGKKPCKYFPVNRPGGEAKARRLAIAHRKEMEETGKAAMRTPAVRQSGHTGVFWHEQGKGWQGEVSKNRQRRYEFFAVNGRGDDEALRLAVEWRNKELTK